ncbi:4Fe-4S dicluster domain-containing protein [Clostridium perfringens]|uniref:Coenzyme F420 hydrogenase/dehydrogenase, beta subunit C-terminal domain n=1 Tax=Clostridium perfringens TaxID=1502 RepID=UPI0013E34BEB|nr:Coenzyme F420 hydrogenase/dehydrogenase, beta subunit C-terminal domain [Clostridium perfringens]NGU73150.1 4Fe-4S dicluster domain-containing protein [Clostridium perfringens]
MIEVRDKKDCCGCAACKQICPKKCIEMKYDEEGFEYPVVNILSCIDCGLCESVCPIKSFDKKSESVESYVAYSKDLKTRVKSSSGAIFSLCAEYVLKNNGIVFGAIFDSEFMVHHVYIDSIENLKYLQGSKYLQSRIENTYQETERFLKEGKEVLYSGTACQIAGLKKYLKKEYSNLYTIDVLCHGVPSPKVWKKYLDEEVKKSNNNISKVFFRNKTTGWKQYSVYFEYTDGTQIMESNIKNDYMRLFLKDICLRPSCYDCKFKSLDRPSDITLGDSWGIENIMPEMDDDKGTSVILIHSKNGKKMFEKINKNMIFKSGDVDSILPPNADSRKSVAVHPKRDLFFEKLNKGESIKELVKLIEYSPKQKINNFFRRIYFKIRSIFNKL